jgi:aminoglycoside phosphotransferase (APT) family kinase protein
MHREEARWLAQLPRSAPVPQLTGVYDDGDWVAVILEDVAGRHPQLPWRIDELRQIMVAIERLQAEFTPCPVPNLPTVVERHRETFDGWRELDKAPDRKLNPWIRRHLVRLVDLEAGWAGAVGGDTLLHADLRADNLLFTEAGSVMFLDWPGACRGAAWFDPLVMAPSVAMQGGPDLEWIIQHHKNARTADPEQLTTLVVAMAGYFVQRSLLPAPPGLPTLRAFQAGQGRAALKWAAARTGWS